MRVYVVYVKGELVCVTDSEGAASYFAENHNPGALPDEVEIIPTTMRSLG